MSSGDFGGLGEGGNTWGDDNDSSASSVMAYEQARRLNVVQYDVEIWQWNTGYGGTYIADISNIITDGLNFSWTLNNTETLDFSIDLVQFEKKCKQMGVTPAQILTPYVHDIRLRRNGEYILGCQVVETNIDIPNNNNVTIQVRCTGFLNLFKDRYLTIPLYCAKSSAYANNTLPDANSVNHLLATPYTTPSYVAGKLVELAQTYPSPVGIVKNPTGDIDRDGWLAPNGWIEGDSYWPHSGQGHIRGNRSGTGWITLATRLYVPINTPVHVSVWVRGQANQTVQFVQRNYVNEVPDTQANGFGYVSVYNTSGSFVQYTSNTTTTTQTEYQRYEFDVTTQWDTTYLLIEQNRTSGDALWVDDLYVSYTGESGRRNFYVTPYYQAEYGSISGSSITLPSHTILKRNYQLQNIKDALLELTEIDDDPIEFYFTPERAMNIGYKGFVGQNNLDLQICYPGNIESMTIARSASGLYNSILNIGSGIGNERIEAQAINRTSMITYGCRESVMTNNNASEYVRLEEEANGKLQDVKDPTNLPKVVIRDGSVNPGNLKIGDRINIYINNGDEYLSTITGTYRVVEYQVSTDLENMETVTLTVEKW